jgi:hypothetical protein
MASKANVKRIGKLRTPKGTAGFAYTQKPRDNFGKTEFSLQIRLDKNDPDTKKFVAEYTKIAKAGLKSTFGIDFNPKDGLPGLKKVDERLAEVLGWDVGDLYLDLKAPKTDKVTSIPVVNSACEATDVHPWKGDTVRAQVGVATYDFMGKKGVKLYLGAVQVLEVGEREDATSLMFEDETDEFEAVTAPAPKGRDVVLNGDDSSEETAAEEGDDDLAAMFE